VKPFAEAPAIALPSSKPAPATTSGGDSHDAADEFL